ncbi:unnamed protein product [Auanema sp. JU1783]|nr:unnamed protein product [Auanema sp. JU1783]
MAVTVKKNSKLTDFFSSPSTSKSKSFSLPRTPLFDLNPPPPKKKKLSFDIKDSKQLTLNAGQKTSSLEPCETCGMIYKRFDDREVEYHTDYHNRFTSLKYFHVSTAKIEKLSRTVFCIRHSIDHTFFPVEYDSPIFIKKVSSIVEDVVNKELGFPRDIPLFGANNRCVVWICVSRKELKYFISCVLVSEILDKAHWNDTHEIFRHQPLFGINRIWTHPLARKQGIASAMIRSAMRFKSCERFAISEPTEAGKKLARSLSRLQTE